MKWLNKLERKFKHLSIKNLIVYIVALNATVYLLALFDETNRFINSLTLVPARVMEGEVWRLFTFIFIPPQTSIIFIFFVLYFYYIIGISLENHWGSFKFNVYYFLGAIFTAFVAFFTGGVATAHYLNLSLFLAFAAIYPDFTILLFFILPVKVKYLALFNWLFFAWVIITYPLAHKITVTVALLNFFIFFGKDIISFLKNRQKRFKNKRQFKADINYYQEHPLHKCTVCGLTEKEDPDMQFRYCSKCVGDYEYCINHLQNHEHQQ